LSGTGVSNIGKLKFLTELQQLDVRSTTLRDLHPLVQFARLNKLAVSPAYWSDEFAEQIKRNNPDIEIYIAFPEDYIEALYK
jgi:hypothetical protein